LQPLQYLEMVSLNRWVFLYFTCIHEVFFRMKGYKLATPVILQSEQILHCCVWLLDQIFSGFTAKDVQWYRPNSAEWDSCCNTMRFTSTIWPIVCKFSCKDQILAVSFEPFVSVDGSRYDGVQKSCHYFPVLWLLELTRCKKIWICRDCMHVPLISFAVSSFLPEVC
jgi:hypothetical protein